MNGTRPENKGLLILATFCYAASLLCTTQANQVKPRKPKNLVNLAWRNSDPI